MPTEQPSNAPQQDAPVPRDELSPGAVLADDRLDTTPGGGGLGGQSAADGARGAIQPSQGPTPNAPMTPPVSADGAPGRAEDEAQTLVQSGTPEPHPSSM